MRNSLTSIVILLVTQLVFAYQDISFDSIFAMGEKLENRKEYNAALKWYCNPP